MLRVINNLLDADTLKRVQVELQQARFDDGKATAQGMAKAVKRNVQLNPARYQKLHELLRKAIWSSAELQAVALPVRMTSVRVARYDVGMEYGFHSDNALIEGLRTDLSFTMFLNSPDSYEGGDLTLPSDIGEVRVRLPAGSIVLYDTGELHKVSAVTKGRREVAVGWIQSQVRDPARRAIVTEMEGLRREYLSRVGSDDFALRMLKCSTNLLRQWAEV